MTPILIIDDDLLFCEALATTLEERGYVTERAHTLERARELLKSRNFAVAFIDVFLPDGNGLDLLAGLTLLPEPPEAIVVTASGTPESAGAAITAGAWDFIQKPAHMGDISLTVERLLLTRERKREKLRQTGGAGMVGESPSMRRILLQMFEAAQSDTPVLITGETGTGKELVARAIHNSSARARGPFVVVDCSAIAANLLESELFGNVRGAFTGAAHSRHGLVRLADRGTLFLDEVGELALDQQRVFLRVLQERSFRPIGSGEELTSDFRVVAATNRNLAEMGSGGTFRNDLMFRLQGLNIAMPPLRARGDDIALLARHALNRSLTRYGLDAKTLSDEVLDAFASYTWPGNVRELLHAVEASTLAAHEDPQVLLQHLPLHLRAHAARARLSERQPLSAGWSADSGLPEPAGARTAGQPPVPAALSSPPGIAAHAGAAASEDFTLSEADGPLLEEVRETGKGASSSVISGGVNAAAAIRTEPPSWRELHDTALHAVRRHYLLDLLRWSGGHIPSAAARAGLSRQRLYRLLREHGIFRQWRDE